MEISRSTLRHSYRAIFLTAAAFLLAATVAQAGGPYQFFTVTPCRVADTRNPNGVYGGPPLAPNTPRNYPIRSTCGIPLTAQAVAFNLTAVQAAQAGNLIVYPTGGSLPNTSVLNWAAGDFAVANGAIIPLAGSTNDITAYANMSFSAPPINLIIDVTGYFQ